MSIKPPDDVVSRYRDWVYSTDHCRSLAHEVQDITGWQLAGIRVSPKDNSQTVIDHIGIRTPSGLFLDSRGLLNKNEFLEFFSQDDVRYDIVYLTRAESQELLVKEDGVGITQKSIKENAENLVNWALTCEAGVPKPPQPLDTVPFPNGKTVTLDQQGFVTGEVSVQLHEVVGMDLEGLLDTLSLRLSGSELLMDISYEPVRIQDGSLVISITGDPSQIFECHYGSFNEEALNAPGL